jgi:ABC-type polysaccharide/polyol phosphate export permease
MGFLDAVWHLFNFIAPAAVVAAGLVLVSRWVKSKQPLARKSAHQFAILFAAGVAILMAGLVFFGRDGKMMSYAALVVGTASLQWVLSGAWRR